MLVRDVTGWSERWIGAMTIQLHMPLTTSSACTMRRCDIALRLEVMRFVKLVGFACHALPQSASCQASLVNCGTGQFHHCLATYSWILTLCMHMYLQEAKVVATMVGHTDRVNCVQWLPTSGDSYKLYNHQLAPQNSLNSLFHLRCQYWNI